MRKGRNAGESDISDKYKILMIDDESDIVGFFAKTFENFPHIEFLQPFGQDRGSNSPKRSGPK